MQIDAIKLDTNITCISGVPVVAVAGEIDIYTTPDFRLAINQAIESGAVNLVVDLTDVSYMDSSGFSALLNAKKCLHPKGGHVNLAGCSESIERMLKITNLDSIFGLFSTVDQAISAIDE